MPANWIILKELDSGFIDKVSLTTRKLRAPWFGPGRKYHTHSIEMKKNEEEDDDIQKN
jgi:hypothetical protein